MDPGGRTAPRLPVSQPSNESCLSEFRVSAIEIAFRPSAASIALANAIGSERWFSRSSVSRFLTVLTSSTERHMHWTGTTSGCSWPPRPTPPDIASLKATPFRPSMRNLSVGRGREPVPAGHERHAVTRLRIYFLSESGQKNSRFARSRSRLWIARRQERATARSAGLFRRAEGHADLQHPGPADAATLLPTVVPLADHFRPEL